MSTSQDPSRYRRRFDDLRGVFGRTHVPRGAYYVIERAADASTFRTWKRNGDSREAELLGSHPTLEVAMAALPLKWRTDGTRSFEAWAVSADT